MNKDQKESCKLDPQVTTPHTIGEWVSLYPETFQIFLGLDIDVCVGGFDSLQKACREKDLDYESTVKQLTASINNHQTSSLSAT